MTLWHLCGEPWEPGHVCPSDRVDETRRKKEAQDAAIAAIHRSLLDWQWRHCRVEGDEVRLWCEVGGHDWRRPYDAAWDVGRGEGGFDESCPEHDGLPLSVAPYPWLGTWPSGYGEHGE